MSKYFLLIGLVFGLFTLQGSVNVSAQSADKVTVKKQSNPKYKLVNSEYFDGVLLLDVVIKPEFLNPEDMKFFAKEIKAKYPKENTISVAFFTDKEFDKNLADLRRYVEAYRASYRLNRTTGEEYLSYAPIGRKSFDREKIDLSEKN
jgi:hypothetical protein